MNSINKLSQVDPEGTLSKRKDSDYDKYKSLIFKVCENISYNVEV